MQIKDYLDKVKPYDNYYRGKLATHLPMAFIALNEMGANDCQMQKFFEYYKPKLEIKPARNMMVFQENWQAYCFKEKHFVDLEVFFASEIKRDGVDKVLNKYLPRLSQNLTSAAFHPLIRLAFAIQAESQSETAAALAYIADACSVITPQLVRNNTFSEKQAFDAFTILEELRKNGEVIKVHKINGLIADRMRYIDGLSEFNSVFNTLTNDRWTLTAIANLSLNLYLRTNNFTALHALTGTQALRVVLPYISKEKQQIALHNFARGIIAAAVTLPVTISFLAQEIVEFNNVPNWQEIFKQVLALDDDKDWEHVIKLSFSAYLESICYPENEHRYRYVAARRCGFQC
ncbi:questin oxidase family protein [Cysteiniphilum litorale]|uniref:questin oxidase family protein n=1 Tax=Cysteiniphilum litorale TaxID=2056700 RepID=UPI003F8816B2